MPMTMPFSVSLVFAGKKLEETHGFPPLRFHPNIFLVFPPMIHDGNISRFSRHFEADLAPTTTSNVAGTRL